MDIICKCVWRIGLDSFVYKGRQLFAENRYDMLFILLLLSQRDCNYDNKLLVLIVGMLVQC